MLFDVLIDVRVPVRAGSARGDVVECLGVFHSVLRAQFAVARQAELANVIAVGRDVVVAQQRLVLARPPFRSGRDFLRLAL